MAIAWAQPLLKVNLLLGTIYHKISHWDLKPLNRHSDDVILGGRMDGFEKQERRWNAEKTSATLDP